MARQMARVARAAALGADDLAAEQLARGGEQRRRDLACVHPRPSAYQRRLELDAGDLGGHRPKHPIERFERVGAQVADQLSGRGDDVEAPRRCGSPSVPRSAAGPRRGRFAPRRFAPPRRAPAARCGPARERRPNGPRPRGRGPRASRLPCGGRRPRRCRHRPFHRPRSTGSSRGPQTRARGRVPRCATPRRSPPAARSPQTPRERTPAPASPRARAPTPPSCRSSPSRPAARRRGEAAGALRGRTRLHGQFAHGQPDEVAAHAEQLAWL